MCVFVNVLVCACYLFIHFVGYMVSWLVGSLVSWLVG